MAHPHLKHARDSHNAKLHRMTSDYQQALSKNPTGNIPGPTNTPEGDMDAVGFETENESPMNAGRKSRGVLAGIPNRARGGRTKHKGTHVNVIVAPQAPAAAGNPPAGPSPATVGAGLAPSPMPRPLPPGPPPGAPMGPMAGPPPGGPGPMPPMPMRKHGGKVKHRDDGGTVANPNKSPIREGESFRDWSARTGADISKPAPRYNPDNTPVRPEPAKKHGGKVSHPDEAEDKVLINKVLKEKGLTKREEGGKVPLPRPRPTGREVQPKDLYDAEGLKRAEANRASGGKVGHYDAGAMSGEGRLEKIKNYGKKAHATPQAV